MNDNVEPSAPFAGITRIRFCGCDLSLRGGTPVEADGTFEGMAVASGTQVAERLLDAFAERDFDAAADLFAGDGQLRALVPQAVREDEGPEAIANRFRFWWDELTELELLEREAARFHDRTTIRYRWRGRDPEDGWVEVEQEGYIRLGADGKIAAMNIVCSGFIPVA